MEEVKFLNGEKTCVRSPATRCFDDWKRANESFVRVSLPLMKGADDEEIKLVLKQDVGLGVAGVSYRAALVLARFLTSSCRPAPGARVLELGCGCGLLGLAAAALGMRVTLTDKNVEALHLAHESAILNGLSERVCFKRLKWGERFEELNQDFNLVLLSDVIYCSSAFEPLLTTLEAVVGPKTLGLLSYGVRDPAAERRFVEALNGHFCVQVREETSFGEDGAAMKGPKVVLLMFCRPAALQTHMPLPTPQKGGA